MYVRVENYKARRVEWRSCAIYGVALQKLDRLPGLLYNLAAMALRANHLSFITHDSQGVP